MSEFLGGGGGGGGGAIAPLVPPFVYGPVYSKNLHCNSDLNFAGTIVKVNCKR